MGASNWDILWDILWVLERIDEVGRAKWGVFWRKRLARPIPSAARVGDEAPFTLAGDW